MCERRCPHKNHSSTVLCSSLPSQTPQSNPRRSMTQNTQGPGGRSERWCQVEQMREARPPRRRPRPPRVHGGTPNSVGGGPTSIARWHRGFAQGGSLGSPPPSWRAHPVAARRGTQEEPTVTSKRPKGGGSDPERLRRPPRPRPNSERVPGVTAARREPRSPDGRARRAPARPPRRTGGGARTGATGTVPVACLSR